MADLDIKIANYDEIQVGDKAEHSKTITETDVVLFAGLSGDFNPLHVNEEYAKSTQFGRRVAHGSLSFSLITCILGTILPGPGTLHVSQKLDFRKPVFIGDTLTATAEVVEKFTKKDGELKFLRIKADVQNQDGVVVTEGESLVIVL
ncbi:MAG TPA: MaoC family dehydratase [Candidatus Lokiarchaeia archaeon]|nr:MaoC family dehydratase [Candidatus Lokiarchaeia archaeon]